MKILVLVNWKLNHLEHDRLDIQPPDKQVRGQPYWFFRYWPDPDVHVDVLDYSYLPGLHTVEKKYVKFYILQSLRAFFRASSYDLIISHGAQSGVVLAMLRSILGRKLPPHIIIDVGCFNGGRDKHAELAPIRYSARSLDGIIYHASVQRDYYERHLPWVPARFIPFGVDSEFFQPAEEETEDYVVATGHFQRDYRTLMEAWRRLPSGKIRLKILGLEQIQGNLPAGVELVDWMPIQEFKRAVARARFVVLPLNYQKFAYGQMSLLQSMAMGKAVIVSRVPGTVNYVNEGNDALMVEPEDPGEMARQVEALWDDPGRAASLGKAARETAERTSEAGMAARIHEFVTEIVG